MALAVQPVVPLATPLPPRLFDHVICVTPTLSDAVPCRVTEGTVVVYVAAVVGDAIVTIGAVASAAPTPLPVATIETVSAPTAKVRLVLTVVVAVGVKRTRTAWLAPRAASVNGDPDTTVNGAPTDTVPESDGPPVFETVSVCSAKLPRLTAPKFTVPVGLTANSARATALATPEHPLSLPDVSTAVTPTL